jgi:hypothetical protein
MDELRALRAKTIMHKSKDAAIITQKDLDRIKNQTLKPQEGYFTQTHIKEDNKNKQVSLAQERKLRMAKFDLDRAKLEKVSHVSLE